MADLEHIHPESVRRIGAFFTEVTARTGLPCFYVSGARATCCGPGTQTYLYDHQHEPGFNPANPPRQSWHEWGDGLPGGWWALAADIHIGSLSGSNRVGEFHDLAATFGLCFPVFREVWHVAPVEVPYASRLSAGAAAAGDSFSRLPAPVIPDPDPLQMKGRSMLLFDAAVARWTIQTHATKAVDVKGGESAVSDGLLLQQYDGNGGRNQQFLFDPYDLSRGVFRIVASHSGRVLDIFLNSSSVRGAGSRIGQWAWSGAPWQLWTVDRQTDGKVLIRSVYDPNLVLDIEGGISANGAGLQVWTANGYAQQAFRVYRRDGDKVVDF